MASPKATRVVADFMVCPSNRPHTQGLHARSTSHVFFERCDALWLLVLPPPNIFKYERVDGGHVYR